MNQLAARIAAIVFLSSSTLFLSALAQTDMFEGRPVFAESADLGYYVWKEGDKWKVRWTTMGQTRRFSGSVLAEGGDLHDLKRIDVEEERRVLYPGRAPRVVVGPRGRARVRGGRPPVVVERKQDIIKKEGDRTIVFAAKTTGDIDGFDFKIDRKVTSLRFVLDIDGRHVPQRVEVGKSNQKLSQLPFVVRIQ